MVTIETTRGQSYTFTDLVDFTAIDAPSALKVKRSGANEISLRWNPSEGADSYKLYRAIGNAPTYELVQSDIKEPVLVYQPSDLETIEQMTLKVTAVKNDRESSKGTIATVTNPSP